MVTPRSEANPLDPFDEIEALVGEEILIAVHLHRPAARRRVVSSRSADHSPAGIREKRHTRLDAETARPLASGSRWSCCTCT